MGEYSQEEVDRLAGEARNALRDQACVLRDLAEALDKMDDNYRPGMDWTELRNTVRMFHWVPVLNRYDEIVIPMASFTRPMRKCNDEHSGLLYEQEHMEVAG